MADWISDWISDCISDWQSTENTQCEELVKKKHMPLVNDQGKKNKCPSD